MKQLIIILSLLSALCAQAQIKYSDSALYIDPKIFSTEHDLNIGLPGGLLLEGSTPNRFFKINIPTYGNGQIASPCISGNSAISFYYEAYKKKVWIYCREIFTMSDERNKKDIDNMPSSVLEKITKSPSSNENKLTSSINAQIPFNGIEYLKDIAPNCINIIDGDTLINYSELIPVLVRATQELKNISKKRQEDIDLVRSYITQTKQKLVRQGEILHCTPNPTYDNIDVLYELNTPVQNAYILISTNSGNIIHKQPIHVSSGHQNISLSNFTSGLYYIILSNNNNTLDSYQIIKK